MLAESLNILAYLGLFVHCLYHEEKNAHFSGWAHVKSEREGHHLDVIIFEQQRFLSQTTHPSWKKSPPSRSLMDAD